MGEELILSILTPAVPSRAFAEDMYSRCPLDALHGTISAQIEIGNRPVEHLIFCDNKRRTVGEKRDALLRIAKGKYIAFVDDDDDIADDYVAEILRAAESNPDVITFRQLAIVNGVQGEIEFRLGNPNEPFAGNTEITRRNAWHVCAWRRQLAICSSFPATNYGEDWEYASKLCAIPGLTEVHIPRVLHLYRHDSKTTEAPCPSPTS